MLAVGIGSLQFLLDKGQEEDWFASQLMVGPAAISRHRTLVVFVVHELRIQAPVVDLRAFKDRTFATGVFLMTVLGFVLYGSLVLLPILLQTLLGYPSLQAGIALAPRGLGSFIAMPIVGVLLANFDARKFLALGLLVASLTLFWFAQLNLQAGYWDFFWPQFVQGISLGFLFVPLTTITMDPIPRRTMGNATSIFNVLRNLGGSMGIAASTTFLARRQQLHINELGSHVNVYNPQARQAFEGLRDAFLSRGADLVTATDRARVALFGMVSRQAAMMSFTDVFRWLAVLFLAALPLLFLMRSPRAGRRGAAGAH